MIKNNNVLLSIGLFALVIAVLLSRYAPSVPVINFLEGFCYALSLVFNMFYLFRQRKIGKQT